MTERAQEIAGKLTKAQRDAILGAALCKGGEYWHPCQRLFPRNIYADDELSRGGVLTPLGLAVRRILERQDHADQ